MNFNAWHRPLACIRQAVPFGIVLALAFALKRYYSLTGADGLVWILAPTARCVGLFTGIPFAFEQGAGFVNLGHRAVIAPACAGVNFMIIVFCMAGFTLIPRNRGGLARLSVIPAALLSAYCCTIVVNALRIGLAVYSYDADLHFGPFTPERIHQIEGTLVYFAGLCIIYAVLMRLVRRKRISGGKPEEIKLRFMTPAAWYLAVTLAVPILLGKFSLYGQQLVEHGLVVLAIPAIISLLFRIREFAGKRNRVQAVKP